MHPSRRRPRLALAVLGGLKAIAGYATVGLLFTGYGPGAYLIHVGAFALLLAGLPTVLLRTGLHPDRRGVVTAGLAFCGLYPLALGLPWAGLVPVPYFPSAPSALGLALDRLGFLLLLTPVAAGYVLGATPATTTGRTRSGLRRRPRTNGASAARRPADRSGAPDLPALAILVGLLAPLIGYVILTVGPGGEQTGPPFLLYWGALFAGGLEAVPFYLVARWGYREDGDPEPFTGTPSDGTY